MPQGSFCVAENRAGVVAGWPAGSSLIVHSLLQHPSDATGGGRGGFYLGLHRTYTTLFHIAFDATAIGTKPIVEKHSRCVTPDCGSATTTSARQRQDSGHLSLRSSSP